MLLIYLFIEIRKGRLSEWKIIKVDGNDKRKKEKEKLINKIQKELEVDSLTVDFDNEEVKKKLKKNYYLEQTDSLFEEIYGNVKKILLTQNSPDNKYEGEDEKDTLFSSSNIVDITKNSNFVLRSKSVPRLPSYQYPGFGYVLNDNGIFFFFFFWLLLQYLYFKVR
jgi:hypothetical protein